MQCPACGFENMRGTERCISCRARLILADRMAPAALVPPRAGKSRWLAPVRLLGNRIIERIPRLQAPIAWLARRLHAQEELPEAAVAALYLSLVPGLGHLPERRWRAMLIWGGGWLALAALTVNFYSMERLFFLPAVLLSWHVSTMVDAARLSQRIAGTWDRLRIMLVQAFLPCLLIYAGIYWVVTACIEVIPMTFSVPTHGVIAQDRLLVRRIGPGETIARGELVILAPHPRLVMVTEDNYTTRVNLRGKIPAMILALPGDRVETMGDEIKVNGIRVPTALCLGQIISVPRIEMVLEKDQVLAIFPAIGRHGMEQYNASAKDLFIFHKNEVAFRPLGIWLPLTRRQRLAPPSRAEIPRNQESP